MRFRLPRVLAILTACSTVLAGMPLWAAGQICGPDHGCCIAAAPCDAERQSLGESFEEERKQEEEQEETDSELILFAGPPSIPAPHQGPDEVAGAEASRTAVTSAGKDRSIRGPPAR